MRKRRIFAYELMACSLMMAGIPAYASTTTSETRQESQSTNEQPPEKPDGEAPSGVDGQQGEKPDGEPPEKPDGEKPDGQPGGGQGGPGGSQGVDSYDAVTEYTEDTDTEGENYTSTGTDENAVLVSNGAAVTLKDSTIDRTSEDSTGGDNSSFYGVGAALLTTDGTTYIDNAAITTDAKGGAGVFAYGDGTVYIADILLSDVDITYSDDSEFFLRCTGNDNARGWGSSGEKGSDCIFTADDQDMEGDVIWDSISDLDFYMTNGSTLTGAIVDDESYAGEGGDGYCNLYLSEDSTWVVDSDSTLTNLYSEGTITDADGNTVSVVGTDGTVYVEGTSEYTITVASYEETVDLSGESKIAAWADYEVEIPEQLSEE